MKSLCIKSNNINFLDYLLCEFKNINIDNVCFSCNEFKNYKNIIIHYKGINEQAFISCISEILSNLVIDEFEDYFIKKYIFHNHFYFNNFEQEKILNLCFETSLNYYYEKHKCLFDIFYKYLSKNKSIILSGFINFRLKDYYSIIENIVDESVNQYIVEKEYTEFISLLKLYISSQPSSIATVHLIHLDNYSLLLDENKNVININDDIFTAKYLSDISFSSNDYILNSLLNLLPNKIYIHLINDTIDEFINTLQLVFENRISLCSDCNICNLYKSINKASLNK